MTDPVALWQERLKTWVGVDDVERSRMRDQLLTFCAIRGLRPAVLLTTWEEHAELTVRRRPGADERPEPAVESFLIHNGINVFGEIGPVAGLPEDLAAQGPGVAPVRE